ncbi:MAG: sulfite exporter TauE/SafE family protein [Rhodoferax sp.]|nr:sulfite exporter TauE/SafE family protein [Rhodoferax sp.]
MQSSLAITALLMGLVGGPHCVVMCGAACAGIGRAAGPRGNLAMWTFQLGRVFGYALLGGVAAASMQGLGWLTTQSAAIRPVWTLFHVAAVVLGLLLLFNARQPVWLESTGKAIWQRTRGWVSGHRVGAPLLIGTVWALLPCGLLYSALLVATLSANALQGAMVMALFALGTSVSMMAGPWLWLRLRGEGSGQWGVRLAGLALAVMSGWAIWMGLVHDTAPWCVTA